MSTLEGRLEHLFMWGTITVFELVFLFFCTVPTFSFLETSTYNWNTMLYVMPTLYTQPAFWFTMVLTIALALFPRFVGKATRCSRSSRRRSASSARSRPTTAARSRASAARLRLRACHRAKHSARPHHRRAVAGAHS